MKYLYATIAFLLALSPSALADDFSVRGGPALMSGQPTGTAKYFGLRNETPESIAIAYELGAYVDNGGQGRRSAVVGKVQLGVKPGPETGLYGKAFIGPCVISATDVLLGGHGQFCTDVGIGVRDRETFMGLGYMHISSAGLAKPNKGRDFVVLDMGVRF